MSRDPRRYGKDCPGRAGQRRWTTALALGAALLLWARPAAGQDADAILQAAADAYGSVETLCADFVQELSIPLLGEERTGRGRLCQAQPDRFAMRFTEPAGDLVVADGEWVWVYYPSMDEKQVIRFPLASGMGNFDFHREFLHDPGAKYDASYEGRETIGGHAVHVIRLVPLTAASYQAAVVFVDVDGPVLRRVRLEEENGSIRTVTLEAIQEDGPVSPDFFTFTPPPGAVVITR